MENRMIPGLHKFFVFFFAYLERREWERLVLNKEVLSIERINRHKTR